MTREKGNEAIARSAAIADASVHHHDGNLLALGYAQKVRPNFRLYKDDHFRVNNAQNTVRKVRQIQGKVQDAVSTVNDLMGHAKARSRNDGDDNNFVRMFLPHFPNNRAGRHDFTD